jgi:hypothetical protein
MNGRRAVAIVSIVAVVIAVVLVVHFRSDAGSDATQVVAADGSFSGHGVAFDYPPAWTAGTTRFLAETSSAEWSESFVPWDGPQGVSVSAYQLGQDLTGAPSSQVRSTLAGLIRDLATQQGGRMTSRPTAVSVAGLSGYRASFTALVNDRPLTNDLTMLFDAERQWNIQCQYAEADREVVMQGCSAVLNSFSVEG